MMADRYRSCDPRPAQRGFSYLALMILVATIGLVSASAVQVGALLQRRAAEKELLFIGGEFQRALLSYAAATPSGASRYPRTIDDLLRDRRYAGTRRHLRRQYVDPMTHRAEWGQVKSFDGGIAAFHSLSSLGPIKRQGFGVDEERLANRERYSDWHFGLTEPMVR